MILSAATGSAADGIGFAIGLAATTVVIGCLLYGDDLRKVACLIRPEVLDLSEGDLQHRRAAAVRRHCWQSTKAPFPTLKCMSAESAFEHCVVEYPFRRWQRRGAVRV